MESSVNRRIRKKKLAAVDRLLSDALQLYATRPRPAGAESRYEELARGLLSLSIGLALRERLRVLPGPRRGCEMDPPSDVAVDMPDPRTITASGTVLIRDRRGEAELGVEAFRLTASREDGRWRMTRVLLSAAAPQVSETAV